MIVFHETQSRIIEAFCLLQVFVQLLLLCNIVHVLLVPHLAHYGKVIIINKMKSMVIISSNRLYIFTLSMQFKCVQKSLSDQ